MNQNVKVDIIFTYENNPQDSGSALITTEMLDDKKEFFKAVTSCLDDSEKTSLVKLSCCVEGASIPKPDHWYLEANGKFWDDEIPQLVKEVWGLDSTITPLN